MVAFIFGLYLVLNRTQIGCSLKAWPLFRLPVCSELYLLYFMGTENVVAMFFSSLPLASEFVASVFLKIYSKCLEHSIRKNIEWKMNCSLEYFGTPRNLKKTSPLLYSFFLLLSPFHHSGNRIIRLPPSPPQELAELKLSLAFKLC